MPLQGTQSGMFGRDRHAGSGPPASEYTPGQVRIHTLPSSPLWLP
jgi:hypothetical protein